MKKLWLSIVLGFTMVFAGCAPRFVRGAYIQPEECGYQVNITSPDTFQDVYLSRCLSLEEATVLAAAINKDMEGKWSSFHQQ